MRFDFRFFDYVIVIWRRPKNVLHFTRKPQTMLAKFQNDQSMTTIDLT